MIVVSQHSADHNTTYPAAAKEKGLELQAIINAAELNVGKVQDINGNVKDAVLTDTVKLEATLAKAGFGADSLGQWFHEGVHVPTPRQLLQETPIKRFQQQAVV